MDYPFAVLTVRSLRDGPRLRRHAIIGLSHLVTPSRYPASAAVCLFVAPTFVGTPTSLNRPGAPVPSLAWSLAAIAQRVWVMRLTVAGIVLSRSYPAANPAQGCMDGQNSCRSRPNEGTPG